MNKSKTEMKVSLSLSRHRPTTVSCAALSPPHLPSPPPPILPPLPPPILPSHRSCFRALMRWKLTGVTSRWRKFVGPRLLAGPWG